MYYFAYGSNMLRSRLEKRVGTVDDLGNAMLSGHKIFFNKISSTDGTGKANIISYEEENVMGVVYSLTAEQIDILDKSEGGYNRITILVMLNNNLVEMETYIAKANRINNELLPTKEYRQYLIDGASEHVFPQDYIEMFNTHETSD
ncbi:MAG TPA: gamma-glutamylcyclotransferase family protein [Sediminibacterium sp.]|uniref:gamma-glutamylcyclotransferase family protein n=1 Tax=Sediminibacterium sp. TaxID=1917865 RepID=UPI002691941C|nr:gamma-glutamylcyclotransferase family protein [Sediminibacterium sp.]HLD53780.1 gamma-glutamylcyclotransferase family protein [Sediminibacterium sp.]